MPQPLMTRESAASAALKTEFLAAKEALRTAFEASGDAAELVRATAQLIDGIIQKLFAEAGASGVAIAAVGGYGRGELFPYSDIDLLFLCERSAGGEALAQPILYALWDLGLKVGHATRSVKQTLQAAEDDMTIRTALLDARFIAGDRKLFESFESAFDAWVRGSSALEFVEAKLAERDARHERGGGSRYMLEPNIKEGKGGLRDLHTLYWLARYTYRVASVAELVPLGVITPEELHDFQAAQRFLQKVRVALHLAAGRAEERLGFDLQRKVAAMLGFRGEGPRAGERFMKRYFIVAKQVGSLTRIFCAALEEEKKRKPRLRFGLGIAAPQELGGFVLDGERLALAEGDSFGADPVKLIRLFQVAQAHGLDIHPSTLREVTRNLRLIDASLLENAQANALFLEILLSPNHPETTLRRMNEAGVLARFVPDFGRAVGQMQYDMYHTYTVDEHTLMAIGILRGIEEGRYIGELPLATELIREIASRRVLYLALFCHDIAKGRGGDHSTLGEKVAQNLARRFGFTDAEIETCGWLVRYHLLLSHTAFRRDIGDEATLREVTEKIQSPERLRLLLILTAADIRAVGPTIWNGWKGALLRDLYTRVEVMMGASSPATPGSQRENLQQTLAQELPNWTEEAIGAYLDRGDPQFWMGCDAPTHARIARLLRRSWDEDQPILLESKVDAFRAATDIVLTAPDQHGLFSKVTGVMALAGANIMSSKIFTLRDGAAVEIFAVQDRQGQAFQAKEKLARLIPDLKKALAGTLDLTAALRKMKPSYKSRFEAVEVPVAVFTDNSASPHYTLIEVSGRDRTGFLYTVTRTLAELKLTIVTAHISTYGSRAVDVFYVKDAFGFQVTHEAKLQQIKEALEQALKESEAA